MAGDHVLDFVREDVLAPGDDHLVVAAVDEQKPVVIDVTGVAGVHVSVDDRLRAAVGVPRERQRSAHEDATVRPFGYVAAVVVEQPDQRPARRTARGRRCNAQVGRSRDRYRPDLGRAVEVVDHVSERVHETRGEIAGERGSRERDEPERRGVVAAPYVGGELDHAHQHHGNGDEDLGAVSCDQRE